MAGRNVRIKLLSTKLITVTVDANTSLATLFQIIKKEKRVELSQLKYKGEVMHESVTLQELNPSANFFEFVEFGKRRRLSHSARDDAMEEEEEEEEMEEDEVDEDVEDEEEDEEEEDAILHPKGPVVTNAAAALGSYYKDTSVTVLKVLQSNDHEELGSTEQAIEKIVTVKEAAGNCNHTHPHTHTCAHTNMHTRLREPRTLHHP